MNYSTIKYFDIANGVGVRTTLFVSGCRLRCPFCFNEAAWDFKAGKPFDAETEQKIIDSLAPSFIEGLSILGGEPFEPENQAGLVDFIERVRRTYPEKSIWIYSGHTLDELQQGAWHTDVTDRILAAIDVLVDGPFVQELYDIKLRFKGSSNQRLIDMPKTLAAQAGAAQAGAAQAGAAQAGAAQAGAKSTARADIQTDMDQVNVAKATTNKPVEEQTWPVVIWRDDPLFETHTM